MGQGHSWHIITGEYPPQSGGVSDYCGQLAGELARSGDEVHVWAPPVPAATPTGDGVQVHRLSSHFGVGSLRELGAGLDRCPAPRRLFVQYVAGAFGYHAMNLPLCLWLFGRRREPLWLMFHEYAYPLGWRLKPAHNLLGVMTPLMGAILAARAQRIFVSTPAWERRMPSFLRSSRPIEWLPIPSNLPSRADDAETAAVRERLSGGRSVTVIGHFGTYGPLIVRLLDEALPPLLSLDATRVGLLMGRGSDDYAARLARRNPELAGRVVATGGLPTHSLVAHMKACDLMVQPYDDGATSRRSSLMASLALGLPIVTNLGPCSEPIWRESGAVAAAGGPSAAAIVAAAEHLLASAPRLAELGRRGAALYESQFALARTITLLRSLAQRDDGAGRQAGG